MNNVKFIRSRSLYHRQFRELLIDIESDYGDVIYHSRGMTAEWRESLETDLRFKKRSPVIYGYDRKTIAGIF
jgi:hypothetical protein